MPILAGARGASHRYEAGPTGCELARLLQSMGVGCEVIAPSLIPRPWRQGPRPTVGTAGGWPGCTGPGNWSPSASRPWPRRRCGICAGPGPTWSRTAPGLGIGWARVC
jgi:hypothetical protein